MDAQKVNSQMQSLAFGEAMRAAAEDYKQVRRACERVTPFCFYIFVM
jgi:hypothetical protein